MNDYKEKGFIASAGRFTVDRVHGGGSRKRTAEIHPSKTDGQDPSVHDRTTADGNDDVGDDVITGDDSASRARRRSTARRRKRRTPTRSGRHGELTGDQSQSGGDDRVDDGDGVPAVNGDDEGADEDGGGLATTTVTSPSSDDDRSVGGARLKRRRRRRRKVSRRGGATNGGGLRREW
ncbi:hypothetical protein [Oryza sativa Japonica Group]|uniref:Retrotransposon protein, putative, unclassified n=1 Tax=Oryza sativa subsp. japonica TaxID=39947 RepID=Q8GSW7_ORYSJ|nr:hypothetical protein [Oryza sativa Japonica Group]